MIPEEKVAVFAPYLEKFETEHVRLYCEDMIKLIPDYIFDIPSSTSGKYHNATQCQPHGQIYHIVMFASVMNYRLELECNKEKFKSPEQRDAMRCTPFFHDAVKCGWNGGKWTVHEHPMLAGEWVRNTKVEHDVDDKVKEAIARMCERHSGQWVSNKKSSVILPKPENAMEAFVHECDILSSRADIDMQPPEYLKVIYGEAEAPKPVSIEDYKVSFPKHMGKTLLQIQDEDPGYITWMKSKDDWREPIKTFLQQL